MPCLNSWTHRIDKNKDFFKKSKPHFRTHFFFSHMACSMNLLRIMREINCKTCLSFDGRSSAPWKPPQSQARRKERTAEARIEGSKSEKLEEVGSYLTCHGKGPFLLLQEWAGSKQAGRKRKKNTALLRG